MGFKMSIILCSSFGGFVGFSYGTLMFTKYQNRVEKDLTKLKSVKLK